MKLIELLRVLVNEQNTEIVVYDKDEKLIETKSIMDLRQDSSELQFEVLGVRTKVIQTQGIGYMMGTEASITLGTKTTIGVKKVESDYEKQ